MLGLISAARGCARFVRIVFGALAATSVRLLIWLIWPAGVVKLATLIEQKPSWPQLMRWSAASGSSVRACVSSGNFEQVCQLSPAGCWARAHTHTRTHTTTSQANRKRATLCGQDNNLRVHMVRSLRAQTNEMSLYRTIRQQQQWSNIIVLIPLQVSCEPPDRLRRAHCFARTLESIKVLRKLIENNNNKGRRREEES